jgi:predicted RNA-binding protein YlxR (DUF448 family)
VPVRTCVGCGKTDEQGKLIRLAITAEGRVKVDAKRRFPGRGTYVHGSHACVDRAIQNSGLAKSFRRKTQPLDAAKLTSEILRNEELGHEQR